MTIRHKSKSEMPPVRTHLTEAYALAYADVAQLYKLVASKMGLKTQMALD
jgi:hypothetical protein